MIATPEAFLLFADPLPEPMVLVAGSGEVLALNRACADRFGPAARAWRGKPLADVTLDPPEALERYLRHCARSRQPLLGAMTLRGVEPIPCRAEGSVVSPKTNDGPAVLMLRLLPKRAAAARFLALNLRVEALANQVQRRKEAERLAADSAERLRTTLASIGDAVITTDREGRITTLNAVAEALTGWDSAEAAGRPLDVVFVIVNEATRLPVDNPATRALQDGVIVGLANHTVLIRRDGTELPIDDSAAPIRDKDGQIVGCVLVFRDITERHGREAELRERERQFVTLAESIPQLAWMAHPDGHIFWYNRRWYDYTGTTPEQMSGWGWQRVHDPAVLPQVLERWRRSIHTGEPFDMVFPLKGADGTFRLFLTRVEPITNDHGQVVRWFGTNTDVDELERTRAALRLNEERLRLAVEATGVGILDYDPATDQQQLSAEAMRIWGFAPGTDTSGQAVLIAVHPDDRARVRAAMAAGLDPEGDGTLAITHRVIRPDGTERWVATTARTVFTTTGPRRPVRSVGTMVDITEARLAEERLRFQLDLTRSITDNATTAIFMMDAQSRCTFMNPAAEAMTGFAFDEVRGGVLHDFIHHTHPDGRPYPMCDCPIDRALPEHGEVRDHQDVFFDKHGEPFPVVVNARVIYKQQVPVGTVIEVRNVATELAAAAALRESERRYRLVGEAANDAIRDWDLVTDVVTWNDGLQRAFGYGRAQVDNDASWWMTRIHPDDRDRIDAEIRAALDGDAETWHGDYRFRRADGTFAAVLDRGRIVREGGSAVRMVGSMLDLTERRRLEDELRRIASELSDAGRKKDEFLATLAHELRNPLAPIRHGLHVLRMAEDRGPVVGQVRTLMDRQLAHIVRLVDDLMDVSRIATGKMHLRIERVGLADVIRGAVETARPLIDSLGHDLTVSLPDDPVSMDVDPARLSQVFLNLLNNAAKFSERGSRIWLTAEQQGRDVVVSIRDEGIGIPAEHLRHVFDMFSQVDSSLERAQGGLGIGLSLVERLVGMHGGSVDVRSEGLGRGAEFVVRLPVVSGDLVTPEPDKGVTQTRALRILVVDDNRDSADSLAMMLTMMGHSAPTAYDGADAVRATERLRPDVLLLDIGLPTLNGYDVCRAVRAMDAGYRPVVIAQTGWGQEEDRQRTREAGFDHHLIKPLDLDALLDLLRALPEHGAADRPVQRDGRSMSGPLGSDPTSGPPPGPVHGQRQM